MAHSRYLLCCVVALILCLRPSGGDAVAQQTKPGAQNRPQAHHQQGKFSPTALRSTASLPGGHDVSAGPAQDDLMSVLDRETRIACARHLKEMGVVVDWRKYDHEALSDMELRVQSARHLQSLDVHVDWRKYDAATLLDMETLADTAQRLEKVGVKVIWPKQ
ncbi:MAG: hypothetical protein JWL77_3635 [Chthonomonadaceae bacterium]|nr:hypothetical protein [Chthonomonadaceae bacterium]